MEELLYSGVGAVLLAAILVLVCLALLGGRRRRGARSSVAGMMVERSEESVLVVSRPGASYTVSTTSISAPSESSDVPSTAFFTAASSVRLFSPSSLPPAFIRRRSLSKAGIGSGRKGRERRGDEMMKDLGREKAHTHTEAGVNGKYGAWGGEE